MAGQVPAPRRGVWPAGPGPGARRLLPAPRGVCSPRREVRGAPHVGALATLTFGTVLGRCSPLCRCSCGTRCWPGSSHAPQGLLEKQGYHCGEAAVSGCLGSAPSPGLLMPSWAGPVLVCLWDAGGAVLGGPLGSRYGGHSGGGAGCQRPHGEARLAPSQLSQGDHSWAAAENTSPSSLCMGLGSWLSGFPGQAHRNPASERCSGHKPSTPRRHCQLLCLLRWGRVMDLSTCTSERCWSGPARGHWGHSNSTGCATHPGETHSRETGCRGGRRWGGGVMSRGQGRPYPRRSLRGPNRAH